MGLQKANLFTKTFTDKEMSVSVTYRPSGLSNNKGRHVNNCDVTRTHVCIAYDFKKINKTRTVARQPI